MSPRWAGRLQCTENPGSVVEDTRPVWQVLRSRDPASRGHRGLWIPDGLETQTRLRLSPPQALSGAHRLTTHGASSRSSHQLPTVLSSLPAFACSSWPYLSDSNSGNALSTAQRTERGMFPLSDQVYLGRLRARSTTGTPSRREGVLGVKDGTVLGEATPCEERLSTVEPPDH